MIVEASWTSIWLLLKEQKSVRCGPIDDKFHSLNTPLSATTQAVLRTEGFICYHGFKVVMEFPLSKKVLKRQS